MGVEYRISCLPGKPSKLAEFLLRAGGRSRLQATEQIEFCFDPLAPGAKPQVTIEVGPTSVYFCDHGGASERAALLFRSVVDEILTCSDGSDSVTITAL